MPESDTAKSEQTKPKGDETFGNTICILSTSLGMPPEEVALLVAGIMGNLSGPAAGIVGSSGRRVAPGFSILTIGTPDHRSKRALDQLLAPALGMQDAQRELALRSHRGTTDMHYFGPADVREAQSPVRFSGQQSRSLNMLRAVEEELNLSDAVLDDWDVPREANAPQIPSSGNDRLVNERLPGPRHCPSFVFSTSDVSRLEEMLAETPDQHAFIVDRSSGFFRGSFLKSVKAGNQAIANLANHLGEVDVVVPRLHAQQGHGRFHRSRLRFMASLPLKQLSEMMGCDDGPTQQLLSQSVLWSPTWSTPRRFDAHWGQSAWDVLKRGMLKVANCRLARTGPYFRLEQDQAMELDRMEISLLEELDRQPEHIRPFLCPFSSILPQLVWSFMLLEGPADPHWRLKAAEAAAWYALRRHVSLLTEAANRARHEAVTRLAEKVLAVLQEKGACGTRMLQRSISRSKQCDIEPALELLVRTARVGLEKGTQRYRILDSPSPREGRRISEARRGPSK